MSRCFPFPPPGYEKKAKPDDVDLLKKEKHKEKKHKKEKKDKEKRESSEKKEKDKSDGKRKDKKDKKEKHRDKKKDKEKDRDKDKDRANDKASTSGEKRVVVRSEARNEEVCQKEKSRDKDKSIIPDERKKVVQLPSHNGEKKPIRNSLVAEEMDNVKFVQELDRRIREEQKGASSQSFEKSSRTDWKEVGGIHKYAVNDNGSSSEGKGKVKGGSLDNRKTDGQGVSNEARFRGSAIVQKQLAGSIQSKVDGMPRLVEENSERTMEGEKKAKEKEGEDKRGDKQKDRDRAKKIQAKDKDREKEKKKEEKRKKKSELKNSHHDKIKDNEHIVSTDNAGTLYIPFVSDNNAATEGYLKKRKDLEANGFLHDNDVRPNKMPRLNSSHPSSENGQRLEHCQTPTPSNFDKQEAANNNNHRLDIKERKPNGLKEAPAMLLSSTKPSSANAVADKIVEVSKKPPSSVNAIADKIAEASKKPPHPDLKYLSQVLLVPKMEDWSVVDDQDWLFNSSDLPSTKPIMDAGANGNSSKVWAEALQIDSADVCAMPYVIPY